MSTSAAFALALDYSARLLHRPTVRVDVRAVCSTPGPPSLTPHAPATARIPLPDLASRLFELPPPDEGPVAVVAETLLDAQDAASLLADRGWSVLADEQDGPRQDPHPALPPHVAAAPWRPNAFLENVLLLDFLKSIPPTGVAMDLGCGSGRDAVFLAQVLPAGWTVVAIDNHRGALDRADALARRHGVALDLQCLDLRRPGVLDPWAGAVDIAHGARFMHRPLVLDLRDRILRRPGGAIVWSTFVGNAQHQPEHNPAPPFKTSRRWVLGEPAQVFSEAHGFTILHDIQGRLATRGVWNPAIFFAATACSRPEQTEPRP